MKIEDLIDRLPAAEREKVLMMAAQYKEAVTREKCHSSFLSFVREMWPGFIPGRHHAVVAKKFEEIAEGKLKRLIICMPPRHTKSELGSYLLPSWFLGRFPGKKIIQTSNTAELAVGFGRKVRNLVDSERYQGVFPNVSLRHDSKAAGRWSTNHNGEYFAIGVGGTVTGKGADLLIIDDPHSEQEAALAAVNPDVFDKVYEWYSSGPRQRLQPGGAIVIIMCMTGDTPVLMDDGTEKPLSKIKVGDKVATYVDGEIATSKILNWRSSGVDSIYKIQTRSGKILRANKEHPFLVEWKGVRKWARLQDLAVGMDLVSTKVVTDHQNLQPSPDCVSLATQKPHITPSILMRRITQWATTASGKVRNVLVGSPFTPRVCALPVTGNSTRHPSQLQKKTGPEELNIGTESLWNNTKLWLLRGAINVTFAATRPLAKILGLTGMESCALTTATTPARFEGFSATTATLPLGTEKHRIFCFERLSIYDVITDQIVSIEPDGEEEVFDIEVEHSENFIANGIVVHNTRWSKRDLVGQVLKAEAQRGGEGWEIIEFPAIMPSGKPLWPEFWPLNELEALKAELPNSKWQAQYQQSPTSESAAIIKREWWRTWEKEDPPYCEFILQAWDTAFEATRRADYSACTTWGVFTAPDNNGVDQSNIILLDAFRDRLEFPSLKEMVLEKYHEYNPDNLIVEKKASGAPLIYELRRMGISVEEYTPVRGAANNPNTKMTRLNAVSDIFASGRVWAPNTQWAEEVIDEVASFPSAEHDDYTDTVSLALMRFRRGGFIQTLLDEEDELPSWRSKKAAYY